MGHRKMDKLDTKFDNFMKKKGFKKSLTINKTILVTLKHIKTNDMWALYQIGKGLYIKDTELIYGGYFKMFETLQEAEKEGWLRIKEKR